MKLLRYLANLGYGSRREVLGLLGEGRVTDAAGERLYGDDVRMHDDIRIDGEALDRYSLYILKPGQAMTLRATSDARVMLLGGEAFTTPRHVWWNFVSSSRDRINQAKHDWKDGKFPLVPGDSEEFIPIPEVPKTVSYP